MSDNVTHSLGHDASPVSGQLGLSPPGKFRPGDATFQYGTPAQLLWSFSWKLLLISSDLELVGAFAPINSKASRRLAAISRSRH